MELERVKEIIDRKCTIPLVGESFDEIEEAYNITSDIIDRAIAKPIKAKRCENCERPECWDCEDNFNRCPNCNESLDNDADKEYKCCPECGQALIYVWE